MFAALAEISAITATLHAAAPSATGGPAPLLAFLEGIGAMEMMLVAVIGLLLFGGKGLPDMARTVGKVIREFKKATQGVEDEVRRVMHEEPEPARPARPPRPRARPQALPASPAAPASPSALTPTPTPAPSSVSRAEPESIAPGAAAGAPPPTSPVLSPSPRLAPPAPPTGPDSPPPPAA